MNPNLTVYSMVQAIEREQLDAEAARGHLAAEAAAHRPAGSLVRRLRWIAGTALVQVGALRRGSAKDTGAVRRVTLEEAG